MVPLFRWDATRPPSCGRQWGAFAVFLSATLWSTDALVRPAVALRMNAEVIVWWEHVLSIALLAPLVFVHIARGGGRTPLSLRMWLCVALVGVGADALANSLLTRGYALGHVALVALLQHSQALFGIAGGRLLLNETLHGRLTAVLMLASFVGLGLMLWPLGMEAAQEDGSSNGVPAALYGLGAAALWGSETVVTRYLLQSSSQALSPWELVVYRQLAGLLGLSVYLAALTRRHCSAVGVRCVNSLMPPSPTYAAFVFVMTVIELTSLALYYVGLQATPANIAAMMELAHPLWMMTVIPPLLQKVDPTQQVQLLQVEQYVGAFVLAVAVVLLGAAAHREHPGKDPDRILIPGGTNID